MTEICVFCTKRTVLRPATSTVVLTLAHNAPGGSLILALLEQREELIHRHFQAGDGYSDYTKHNQNQADERYVARPVLMIVD
jgi:hypothetical protein